MEKRSYRVVTLPASTAPADVDWSVVPAASIDNFFWLEGHTPDDRLSRLLSKFIRFCAPPFALVWGWVAGLFSKLRRNSPEKK